MLKTGSKSLRNYLKSIQNIENGKNLLFFLETPPIKNDCNSCKKLGSSIIDCKKCKNGECLKCEGMGQHKSGRGKNEKIVDCRSCKTSGFCGTCQGQIKLKVTCKPCTGTGSRFNKSSFASEEKRSYQVLIHKSASLSKSVDFEVDKQLLTEDQTKTAEGKKWLAQHKKKIAAFEAKEQQRIAMVTGTAQARPMMTKGDQVQEDFENGKSTDRLKQLCKEVEGYIKGQERKSKMVLLQKVYGKYKNDLPTVHIVLKSGFTSQAKDWRLRTGQGFYQFAKLRGMTAGYDKIGFILLDQKGKILGKINQ